MTNIHALARVSEPGVEPLSLDEAKAYLKITTSSDDDLITGLISAVRKMAEEHLRASLITQSWKLSYDKYTPSCIRLPFGPVQGVTSVTAIARDATCAVIDSASYYLASGNRRLIFDASVLASRVDIVYVAGYGNSGSDVPSPIRYGMLAHLAAIYDGRAGQNAIPKQAVQFYGPYREVRV